MSKPAKPAVIDNKKCSFVPESQIVAPGPIEIVNSDPVLHNTHGFYGKRTAFNVALPNQGQRVTKDLPRSGLVRVECDEHGHMHATVYVADHPYHAVTGADGAFTIKDVPPGNYTLVVYQRHTGPIETPVAVKAKETTDVKVDLKQLRPSAHDTFRGKVMSEIESLRREMDRELRKPGEHPDRSLNITRRIFLHRSLLTGAVVTGATYGWFPLLNTIEVAHAQDRFQFAWLSDTHLYPRDVNERFVEKTVRAIKEIQALNPPADFLMFGGDLAQLADPVELKLGAELLKEVQIKKHFIPGEHDWYLDMGKLWTSNFGKAPWTFDHKGVRFVGLDTVSRAPDYWSAKKMSPKERMGHMATLDGSVAGAWAGLGPEQLAWLDKTLSGWGKDKPIVIFSHNPLYEYYPPWNFWIRDWRELHEVIKPYKNVTNIHGHTHQVLYNEIGSMRSIGMLATSWPWPYAPEGVPTLSKAMVRANPGNHFDGVGWSRLTFDGTRMENEYVMWRKTKTVLAETAVDSGTGDNVNQILSPRVADRLWPY